MDGERHSWRDGHGVVFDETYLHWAENRSDKDRLILFCDIERLDALSLGRRGQPLDGPQG